MPESITGTNTFIVYENVNGYRVCRFKLSDGRNVTVVGNIPGTKNLKLKYIGEWIDNQKFGKQFKVESYETLIPDDETSVIAYLSSLKCGIGRTWAKRIFDKFGDDTWKVLSSEPDRLLEIEKFGEDRKNKLVNKLNETKNVRDVTALFAGKIDVSSKKIEKIVKFHGSDSVDIIQNDPYSLCDISGIGFYTAEVIGREFNASPDDRKRVEGCIKFIIEQAEIKGHVCIPEKQLLAKTYKELNEGYVHEVVSKDRITQIIGDMLERYDINSYAFTLKNSNDVIRMIYNKNAYFEESDIANNLYRLMHNPFDSKCYSEKITKEIENFSSANIFSLADTQKKAIFTALTNKVTIITGGPGVGKTTICKAMLYVHKCVHKDSRALLLAPTGRAARRLSEETGYKASTIHSAIGYMQTEDGMYMSNTKSFDANFIIVDEASMIDQHIMAMLLNDIPSDAQLVIVGDPDQLSSVGYGNILHDLILSKVIPTVKLEVIFRQGEDSPIISNAQKILNGETDLDFEKQGFYFKETASDAETLKEACKFYAACVQKFGIDNVTLLTPLRKDTKNSVREFNKQLQNILNPPTHDKNQIALDMNDVQFRTHDKVMQTKNTNAAKNGDVGYINNIGYVYKPSTGKPELSCGVDFDGNELQYTPEDMKNVDLAYANTIHKSQGSQYKTVIVIMSNSHKLALKRNLIYTAITRAEQNVAIIGQKEALVHAIETDESDIRYTCLAKRLRSTFDKKTIKEGGKNKNETQNRPTYSQLSLL